MNSLHLTVAVVLALLLARVPDSREVVSVSFDASTRVWTIVTPGADIMVRAKFATITVNGIPQTNLIALGWGERLEVAP